MVLFTKKKKPRDPKPGEKVCRTRFAFFPTYIDEDLIWWENYHQYYKCVRNYPHGENYFLIYDDMLKPIYKKRIEG